MMKGLTQLALFIILGFHSGSTQETEEPSCPPVTTAPNFDLAQYVKSRWYIHQQAPTTYVPVEKNYCVHADYAIKESPSLWRYTVDVLNYAENAKGESFGGPLCAANDSSGDPAKLMVAPCMFPKFVAGPYWVLAYDEAKGYALVSGGQPTYYSEDGCRTGSGVNDSGLWIFLRSRERNEELIQEVRGIAKAQFFDLSVLNDVDQTNCKEVRESEKKREEMEKSKEKTAEM